MRKKFIEVYDDILPKEISDTIENLVLEQSLIPLFYTSNVAKKKSKIFNPAFGDTFYDPSRDIYKPYSHMFLEVVYRLGNALNIVVEGIMQGRIFIHLPSPNPGLDQKHIDTPDDHYVCLYYINDSEGDTIIFNDNEEEIQRITPKKGRIVFFEGSMHHCSTRPSTKTRAILNFNFQGYKFIKEKEN
tara:strand:+ start:1165 stop:1725 length:561 start_codon:yes stop_codon:yes gene_type:complete